MNDARGLEHGFTVRERPSSLECARLVAAFVPGDLSPGEGAFSARPSANETRSVTFDGDKSPGQSGDKSPHSTGALTFTLAVRGGLRPEVQADGQGVLFQDDTGATVLNYTGLKVWDADGKILPSRFETVPVERGRSAGLQPAAACASQPCSEHPQPPAPSHLAADRNVRAPQGDATCFLLAVDERGARYPLTIDPIAQQAYLKPAAVGTSEVTDKEGRLMAIIIIFWPPSLRQASSRFIYAATPFFQAKPTRRTRGFSTLPGASPPHRNSSPPTPNTSTNDTRVSLITFSSKPYRYSIKSK